MGLMLRLRGIGIADQEFLRAVESVPHDQFVPKAWHHCAWQNTSLPIECGQTSYAPDISVRIIDAARIMKSHTVLEVGTGAGYMTALIARKARKVRSLDRFQTLVTAATQRLSKLGIDNATIEHADGQNGTPGDGLYDCVIIDSVFDQTPRQFIDQLVAGGTVICAIGDPGREQMLTRFTKIGSRYEKEDLFPVRFSPLEDGKAQSL